MSSAWAVVALGLLTFLVTVASIFGSFRVSRNTSAVSQYRETALAWEGQVKVQKEKIAELEGKLAQRDQQITSLEAKVAVLQDTVTGKSQLDLLDRRTQETRVQLGSVAAELHDLHEYLTGKLGGRERG